MTIHQLEEAIGNQYDNGRYTPLGADGGVLKYIMVDVNGQKYRASITLDLTTGDVYNLTTKEVVMTVNFNERGEQ